MSLSEVALPANTPEIDKAEKANDRLVKIVLVVAVLTLIGVSGVLWLRFGDAAKQSTAQKAATRALVSAERNDCRSTYNAIRADVIENAQAKQRESLASIERYLLSRSSTDSVQVALTELEAANAQVEKLKPLPDMVDNGFTDSKGKKYPPCPVVT